MNRALAVAAILFALCAGYLLFKTVVRPSTPASASNQSAAEIEITTSNERETTTAYSIDMTYPQFGIPSIDADIKGKIDLSIGAFKSNIQEAGSSTVAIPYELRSMFDSVYVGPDVLSVRIIVSSYLGGAHGIDNVNGLNFERTTGRELTPDDAFAMIGLTLETIAATAMQELQAKLGSDIITPEGADPKLENYSTFVISKDKVTFMFQVYQVAPYAAGPQEVSFDRKR